MAREKNKKKNTGSNIKLDTLVIDDAEYKTVLTTKFKNRKKYEPKNEKEISSFIPGTIKDIFVKEGAKVNEGDKLLTLEAMKMVNNIVAPVSGKIKKIWVNMGEKVTKNQLLVELE